MFTAPTSANSQVAEGDVVLECEWALEFDDIVETVIRGILQLRSGVRHDGTVCEEL